MIRIIIASDQADLLRDGSQPLEIVDDKGVVLGCYWQAFSQTEIGEAKRRAAAEPGGKTTDQVMERLAGLEQE